MVEVCYKKCVTVMKEADLTTGESTCVDRCVFKYVGSHNVVGECLQSLSNPQ